MIKKEYKKNASCIIHMSSNWTEKAIEPFFNLLEKEVYDDDKINMDKVYCSESSLIKGQRGVFALESIKKGEIIEWGIATIIPVFPFYHTYENYCVQIQNQQMLVWYDILLQHQKQYYNFDYFHNFHQIHHYHKNV